METDWKYCWEKTFIFYFWKTCHWILQTKTWGAESCMVIETPDNLNECLLLINDTELWQNRSSCNCYVPVIFDLCTRANLTKSFFYCLFQYALHYANFVVIWWQVCLVTESPKRHDAWLSLVTALQTYHKW